jgi:hypothetical protein
MLTKVCARGAGIAVPTLARGRFLLFFLEKPPFFAAHR